LIELLVVIAIIGILASMMLPALAKAKEKANMSTCRNNLHQLAIATRLYIDDCEHRFPLKYVPRVNPTTGQPVAGVWNAQWSIGGADAKPQWMDMDYGAPPALYRPFFKYVAPSQVYRCPRDKGMPASNITPSNWDAVGCSYHYNAGRLSWVVGPESVVNCQIGRQEWAEVGVFRSMFRSNRCYFPGLSSVLQRF
jgi:type II secretory pathway pseudopilin PulG